jgi:signal transduction histidine kinase
MTDAPWFLLSSAAMRSLPVCVIDVVAGFYLLLVWRRADVNRRAELAALPLGLYFLALAGLAFAQVMMSSVTDLRHSFMWNHAGQTTAVALSVPALLRVAYRYVDRSFDREERLVEPLAVLVAVCVSLAFIVGAVTNDSFTFDPVLGHSRLPAATERTWDTVIATWVFLGYLLALVVLWRKARRLVGVKRWRVVAFSVVVCAAIAAVVLNQLEAVGALPSGFYATYMVWVTLGSMLLFMGSTDEITSFRERTVSLVLVAELAIMASIMQRAVDTTAVHGPRDGLSGLALRMLVHETAAPFAWILLGSVLLTVLVMPALAEVSVLRPLAALVRAEAHSRAKTVFLAQMSHELRTPLHTILHHARSPLDPTRCSQIERAASDLLAMIEALLQAGREDAAGLQVKPEACEIDAVLHRAVDAHRAAADAKGLALRLTCSEPMPGHLTVDAVLLSRLLSNLVGNAVKYTDVGSIDVQAAHRDGVLELRIDDTGRGIPRELQERVFQPFFQVDGHDGVGLGLSIVRQAVDALEGELTLDSAPGRGTRVVVRVPVAAASAAQHEQQLAVTLPDEAARVEIVSLARVGDVVALRERVRSLASDRPELGGFAARVEDLAAQYQMRALRRLLGDEPPAQTEAEPAERL